jgi:acylphosphatase
MQATRSRTRVFYTGRVQGVGFRYTARSVACGYEVTGFVRNLPDGRVELVAEGADGEVEAYLEGIRQSGLGPHIRQEQVQQGPATGEFAGFEIRF